MSDAESTAMPSSPEEAFRQSMERGRELNEQIMETARQAGGEMLKRYVSWLEGVAAEQQKLASAPQVSEMEWMAAMLNAQAEFTRAFARSLGQFAGGASQ